MTEGKPAIPKRRLYVGDKSRAYVAKALELVEKFPKKVPPNIDVRLLRDCANMIRDTLSIDVMFSYNSRHFKFEMRKIERQFQNFSFETAYLTVSLLAIQSLFQKRRVSAI